MYNKDFWNWHVTPDGYTLPADSPILDSNSYLSAGNTIGAFTHFSGYGSKCKVEIISKSDLLRARGYKN